MHNATFGVSLISPIRRTDNPHPPLIHHPPPATGNSSSITTPRLQPPAPLRYGRRDQFCRTVHKPPRTNPMRSIRLWTVFSVQPAAERLRLPLIRDSAKHRSQRPASDLRARPAAVTGHPKSGCAVSIFKVLQVIAGIFSFFIL